MKKEFIEIANAYGWHEIESKNPYMYSLVSDSHADFQYRMNVYTTCKVQIQPMGIKHSPGKIYTDINTVEKLEDILMHFKHD